MPKSNTTAQSMAQQRKDSIEIKFLSYFFRFLSFNSLFKPVRKTFVLIALASRKYSDEHVHLHSVASAITAHT